MRRIGAEPRRELLFWNAVAPAQEIDDVERAQLAEQLCPAVRLRAPDGLFEQRHRLQACGDVLGPVGDFADADDDGNTVFGEGGVVWHFFLFRFLGLHRPHPEEPRSGVSKDGPRALWFETALRASSP